MIFAGIGLIITLMILIYAYFAADVTPKPEVKTLAHINPTTTPNPTPTTTLLTTPNITPITTPITTPTTTLPTTLPTTPILTSTPTPIITIPVVTPYCTGGYYCNGTPIPNQAATEGTTWCGRGSGTGDMYQCIKNASGAMSWMMLGKCDANHPNACKV